MVQQNIKAWPLQHHGKARIWAGHLAILRMRKIPCLANAKISFDKIIILQAH